MNTLELYKYTCMCIYLTTFSQFNGQTWIFTDKIRFDTRLKNKIKTTQKYPSIQDENIPQNFFSLNELLCNKSLFLV